MSTIFVLRVMGVRACSRSVRCVHSGCAKRVRFSYRANRRTSLAGVLPSPAALSPSRDFSYFAMVLESRWRISKR